MRLVAVVVIALLAIRPCAAQTPPLPPPPQPPVAGPAWLISFDAGSSIDWLSNGYSDWTSTYLFARERAPVGRPTYYEFWNSDQRYGYNDQQFGIGGVFYLTGKTLVGAAVADSPTHHILPSFDGTFDLEQRLGEGYGVIATYTRRTYTTTNASIENFSVDRYVGKFRVAYAISFAQLSNTPGTAITQTISGTWYGENGADVALSVYGGRDVESTGPTSVLVMDVAGGALNGHAPVAKRLSIAYGAEAWSQGKLFTAAGMRLGLRYAFQ